MAIQSDEARRKVQSSIQKQVHLESELKEKLAEEAARSRTAKLSLQQKKREIDEAWLKSKREHDMAKNDLAALKNRIKNNKLQVKKIQADIKLKRVLAASA